MPKKPIKICIADSETTGTDPYVNDILHLSLIIEIDRTVIDRKDFFMQPTSYETIDPGALLTNGFTIDQIKKFPLPNATYHEIVEYLSKFVDKYNPEDKLYFCAYKADFDYDFLRAFFEKNQDSFIGSFFNSRKILDPRQYLILLDHLGFISFDNFKLSYVCSQWGIPLQAHQAQSDAEALRLVFNRIRDTFNLGYFTASNDSSFNYADFEEEDSKEFTEEENQSLDNLSQQFNQGE